MYQTRFPSFDSVLPYALAFLVVEELPTDVSVDSVPHMVSFWRVAVEEANTYRQ